MYGGWPGALRSNIGDGRVRRVVGTRRPRLRRCRCRSATDMTVSVLLPGQMIWLSGSNRVAGVAPVAVMHIVRRPRPSVAHAGGSTRHHTVSDAGVESTIFRSRHLMVTNDRFPLPESRGAGPPWQRRRGGLRERSDSDLHRVPTAHHDRCGVGDGYPPDAIRSPCRRAALRRRGMFADGRR